MAFKYYSPVTVQSGQVPAAQTDFPMLVSYTDNRLKTTGNGGHVENANGYDIRPYSNSALTSALTFELEFYDASAGTVVMWVKIASIDVGSIVYLAYGDAALNTNGSSTATWDSNYKGVYHLNESAVNYIDSTSNANNGTTTSGTVTQVGGKIYNGQNFAATSYIRIPNFITSYPVTVEYWATTTVTTNNPQFNIVNTGINVAGGFSGSGAYYYTGVSNKGAATSGFVDNAWNHIVLVQTSSSAVTVYTNGVDNSTNTNSLWNAGANSAIGARTTGGFTGKIDEFRVSDATRSADWVATGYNNQSAPSTFAALGTEVPFGVGRVFGFVMG